jgi:SHS2 domain-containing protein
MGSHTLLDHTGEVILRLEGATEAEVLAEAALGLGELEREGLPATGERTEVDIAVEAADRPGLLVNWLNEIIYRCETASWVPDAVRVLDLSATGARATLAGPRLAMPPALVKAATHHRLRFEPTASGWEGEVLLDV